MNVVVWMAMDESQTKSADTVWQAQENKCRKGP